MVHMVHKRRNALGSLLNEFYKENESEGEEKGTRFLLKIVKFNQRIKRVNNSGDLTQF